MSFYPDLRLSHQFYRLLLQGLGARYIILSGEYCRPEPGMGGFCDQGCIIKELNNKRKQLSALKNVSVVSIFHGVIVKSV